MSLKAGCRSAVHPKGIHRDAGVLPHQFHQVSDLIGDTVQTGFGNLRLGMAAGIYQLDRIYRSIQRRKFIPQMGATVRFPSGAGDAGEQTGGSAVPIGGT